MKKITITLIFCLLFLKAYPSDTPLFGLYVFKPGSSNIEEEFFKIKQMGFNSVLLAATDEDVENGKSVAFFPSSIIPLADNTEADYFAKAVEIAHKYGLKVYAWFNLPNEHILSMHPDWISVLSDGNPSDYYRKDYFQRLIPPARILRSTEYKQLLSSLISEICAYDIDGFDLNDNFQWAEWYISDEEKTLTASFDSFTVGEFSNQTGIEVPGNSPQEYANYILNNEAIYQKWLEWKSLKVSELLKFIKSEISKSGKFIPFRPHLLASKWAYEDYGIDYKSVCKECDIPYLMLLLDSDEQQKEKYSELISLLSSECSKKIAVSTYLYDISANDESELEKRLAAIGECEVYEINIFNLSLINSGNLEQTVKTTIANTKKLFSENKNSSRLGLHIVGLESANEQTIENTLKLVDNLEAKWIRVGAIWYAMNPSKDEFNFSYTDTIVAKALKYNLNILMPVAYTPQWLSENPEASDFYLYPPTEDNIGDYQSPFGTGSGYDYLYLFAKKIAERYKDKVEYFELWNEEDCVQTFKTSNQERSHAYAKMLFYFYKGIKAGNPEAKVLIGGLADNSLVQGCDTDFLTKILSDSQFPAGDNFDIHNIHTNFKSPEEIKETVARHKDLLSLFNQDKKIWITETSYSPDINFQINGFLEGEKGFEKYIETVLKEELSLIDGVVFWTPLLDLAEESSAYRVSGLFRKDFSPKSASSVFKGVARGEKYLCVIPHIAEANWETKIRIYNESGKECPVIFKKYVEGTKEYRTTITIPPLSSKTLTNADFGYRGWGILSSLNKNISVKLSYQYKNTPSLSTFELNGEKSSTWIIPIKNISWFDWNGIALANHLDEKITLTFQLYKNGGKVKEQTIELAPYSKTVGTLKQLFDIEGKDIDFIAVKSDKKISAPILIAGNSNQDRHAFFKGIKPESGGNYYINHIAEENWETEIEITNPNSFGCKIYVYQYGESTKSFEKEIPSLSKLTLTAGKELDYSTLAKIQCDYPLAVTVYYRYKDRPSICAFTVSPDNVSKNILITDNIPQWFDWSGIAFANFLPLPVSLTLTSFKNGIKTGESSVTLNPYSKSVNIISGFIENLNPQDFDTIKIKSLYPIPLPIVINGNSEQDRHTFFKGEKLNAKQYPLLANYFLDWELREDDAVQLAKRDLIVLDMEHGKDNQEILKTIKQFNPEIKILAYMTGEEIETDSANYPDSLRGMLFGKIQDSWWLKNCSGEHIVFWPGTWMLNCSSVCPQSNGLKWNDVFADFIVSNVLSCKYWDGFYIDNCWSTISWIDPCIDIYGNGTRQDNETVDNYWKKGMETMIEKMKTLSYREYFTGNGGYDFYSYLNGALIEEFTMWDCWFNQITLWQRLNRLTEIPRLNVLNGCGEQDNYPFFRYSLCSALISDGYFAYDLGSEDHSQHWFYDEYSINLGVPLDEGKIVFDNPVMSETFETPQWETESGLSEITAQGINGNSLIGNSLNSSEEWNEFLFSPPNMLSANSEIVIEFKYRVLQKEEGTKFYITVRPESMPDNYDIITDIYYGENAEQGETLTLKAAAILKNANDYIIVFGIKGKGKIIIDDINVYSNQNAMYARREFENGIVICNNSTNELTLNLDGGYKKINGEKVSTVTVAPKDGIILLKTP